MALPLLNYKPSSQNQRVASYEVPGDEQPRIFSTDNILDPSDMDALVNAAYRQVFFHAFKWDREPFLESQLRNGQITVRDFVRGLALSKTFYNSFYEKNSNYRFVEHCVQKLLGREVYNEREKIAWSIVVATKGIQGLVDQLLDSDEYLSNFGYSTVPFQRRRILPGRPEGERPIHISNPRYDDYHRNILGFPPNCLAVSGQALRTPREEAHCRQPFPLPRYGAQYQPDCRCAGAGCHWQHQHCYGCSLPQVASVGLAQQLTQAFNKILFAGCSPSGCIFF